jgi:hypothetical protein
MVNSIGIVPPLPVLTNSNKNVVFGGRITLAALLTAPPIAFPPEPPGIKKSAILLPLALTSGSILILIVGVLELVRLKLAIGWRLPGVVMVGAKYTLTCEAPAEIKLM